MRIGAFGEPGRYSREKGDIIIRAFIDRFLQLLGDIAQGSI
jgi:hypothetical protein